MSLRIVSGKEKGRKLRGPKKETIRPASARVRKSLFDILGDLSGKRVLDLFAGTGSIGLESLSKGASEVTFVDSDPYAVSLLLQNLKKTPFLDRAFVVKKKASRAIEWFFKKNIKFDLIFLDPPYDKGHIEQCIKKLNEFDILEPDGVLLCEHSPREIPKFLGGLEKVDQRKYGQTLVSFFRHEIPDEPA